MVNYSLPGIDSNVGVLLYCTHTSGKLYFIVDHNIGKLYHIVDHNIGTVNYTVYSSSSSGKLYLR